MDDIVVIKCGGSTINSLTKGFFKSVQQLKIHGKKPLIVHGGGPSIKQVLDSLNIKSEFINGLRKTTREVMDVVEMVLGGKVSTSLVQSLQAAGLTALGLTGSDGQLLQAKAKNFEQLGFVGEPVHVNTRLLHQLLDLDIIPVIAPLASGVDGVDLYNINADTAAEAIASALSAQQLVFVTDVPGVLKNQQLIQQATANDLLSLIKEGVITGGMIPKVKAAIASLKAVNEVVIVSGQTGITNQEGQMIGTKITNVLEASK